jgi:aldose 1-epimerase
MVSSGPATYTLQAARLRLRVLSYGGILQSLETPDRLGRWANVSLGFAQPEDYLGGNPAYFGAIIGRVANRIRRGTFVLDGATYHVPSSDGANALHGGVRGFDKRDWTVDALSSTSLRLTRVSPAGEEGFPGELHVQVTYAIVGETSLRIDYLATTDAPTVVNLTHHAYFNLGGAIDDHVVWLNASAYMPVDDELLPTGDITPVDGTVFDFRQPTRIGGGEFDHNWVLDGWDPSELKLQARVSEPTTGRVLEVRTTEPGIQFYTGNLLDGRPYARRSGFTLETQHFPDSPNRAEFPSTVLRPGNEYRSTTIYAFGLGG